MLLSTRKKAQGTLLLLTVLGLGSRPAGRGHQGDYEPVR